MQDKTFESRKFFDNQKSVIDIYRWILDIYQRGVTLDIDPYPIEYHGEEYIQKVESGKENVLGAGVEFFTDKDRFHKERNGNKIIFYFTDRIRMPEMYAPFSYDSHYRQVSAYNADYALSRDFRAQLEPYYTLTETPKEILVKRKNQMWGRYYPAKFPMQRQGRKVYDIFTSAFEYCCAVGYYPVEGPNQIIEGNCVFIDDDENGNIKIEMRDRISKEVTGQLDLKNIYNPNWKAPVIKDKDDTAIDPGDILVIWKDRPDEYGAETPTEFLKVLDCNETEAKVIFLAHSTNVNDLSWSHYRGLHTTTIYPQLDKEKGGPFIAKYDPDKKMPLEAPELEGFIGMEHWDEKDVQIAYEDTTD